jgi:hypothetical protein
MTRWILIFAYPDRPWERREFWAAGGDDCFLAIRSETSECVAGYQRAE